MRYIGVWCGLLGAVINVPLIVLYDKPWNVAALGFCLGTATISFIIARSY